MKFLKFEIKMGKKSISTETRWQIIGLYKSGTLSNIKIGEITNVSEKCVRTTIKNYENYGTANETPRSGRPEKFSDQDKRSIIMMSRKNPTLSLRNLATEFNSIQNNHSVSKRYDQKDFTSKRYRFICRSKKTIIKSNGPHKTQKVVQRTTQVGSRGVESRHF